MDYRESMSYARGLDSVSQKDEAVARRALAGLPNKVMAAEYRTALPDTGYFRFRV